MNTDRLPAAMAAVTARLQETQAAPAPLLDAMMAAYDADTKLRETLDRGLLAGVLERLLIVLQVPLATAATQEALRLADRLERGDCPDTSHVPAMLRTVVAEVDRLNALVRAFEARRAALAELTASGEEIEAVTARAPAEVDEFDVERFVPRVPFAGAHHLMGEGMAQAAGVPEGTLLYTGQALRKALRAALASQAQPKGSVPADLIREVIAAEAAEGKAQGGFIARPSTREHQRRVFLAWQAVHQALDAAPSPAPAPDVLGYAQRLAVSMWEKHYKADAPGWKPFDELPGVLTQIDNMLTGLARTPCAAVGAERDTATGPLDYMVPRVAEALKAAIKGRGIAQAELARRLECSEAEVSDRLSGRRNLTLSTMAEMCDLTGLRMDVRFYDPKEGDHA